MAWEYAIIGGSGIGSVLQSLPGSPVRMPTSRGVVSLRRVQLEEFEIFAVSRHASGHRVPPQHVPYQAIAEALHRLGVRGCLSTAAVGSLVPDWHPGTLAIVEDMIDLSARNQTRFEDSIGHTDMTTAFPLAAALVAGAQKARQEARQGAVYINVNGPRYETPAEIKMMNGQGGSIVGMTVGSEAVAMREWGVPYGCLSIVTNLAAGLSPSELAHDEVTDVMGQVHQSVLDVLVATLRVMRAT